MICQMFTWWMLVVYWIITDAFENDNYCWSLMYLQYVKLILWFRYLKIFRFEIIKTSRVVFSVFYPGFSLREGEFSCREGRQKFSKEQATMSAIESIILTLSKYLCFIGYLKVILFHVFEKYAQNIRRTNKK
jgi:hypothetical protein